MICHLAKLSPLPVISRQTPLNRILNTQIIWKTSSELALHEKAAEKYMYYKRNGLLLKKLNTHLSMVLLK